MILIWRARDLSHAAFRRYAHTWKRFAAAAGEEVVVDELTDRQQLLWWDRVNELPGRIVWIRPEFIPWPSFFDELDVYRESDQLVVAMQNYDALFNLGQHRPARWEPNETVSRSAVVFQLSGQRRWTLPPSSRVDPWRWLATTKRSNVYRLPQTYSGNENRGVCCRSVLGETVMAPWGTHGFGRLTTGGRVIADPRQQMRTWNEVVDAWRRFVG